MDLYEIFWAKVDKSGDCWEWIGSICLAGYGILNYRHKTLFAHRLAYKLTNGEIPDGKIICHTCNNRKCVNPKHLQAGTHKDNAQHKKESGRGNKGLLRGRPKKQTTDEKFWDRVVKTDTCWNWVGHIDEYGYGRFSVYFKKENEKRSKRRKFHSHRWSYERFVGPIPEGLLIRHKCDNRACVNPTHLEPGSYKDNARDTIERGRTNTCYGEEHGSSKLTEKQVKEIILLCKTQSVVSIAKKYNVSTDAIQHIKLGDTWKHLPR